MAENLCLDESRIFAAGFSNGGQMTYNLTCSMHDTFQAFAGVGMQMSSDFFPKNCGLAAEDVKPMLQICGMSDSICNRDTSSWFDTYAEELKCAGNAITTDVSSTTKCKKHSRCGPSGNEPLEQCEISALGHCWSGNDCCGSSCTNQNRDNIDASAYILDWFSSVPRRSANKVPLAQRLREQLSHTTVSFEISPSNFTATE